MEIFLTAEGWIALLTLTLLEIVLGIDNIIFIAIVSDKLPAGKQPFARTVGLFLALLIRIAMLLTLSWVIGFTDVLFTVLGHGVSGKDLILIAGGLFLLGKSTLEIHDKIEGENTKQKDLTRNTVSGVIVQIILIDIVFSFDSILTAIGMSRHIEIMVTAVVISIIIMIIFSGRISSFINRRPTLQVLALSFLILIGFMLVAEGLHFIMPKGYIYFAVVFSLLVEMVNMRISRRR